MTAPLNTAREALTDDQIKHMVDRFLCWRLPADFRPDAGISYTRPTYAPEVDATPFGTNLFDAGQAEAMVRYMAEGAPLSAAQAAPAVMDEDAHERDLGEVIDQRDDAEQALSHAYYLVTGRSPNWSSAWGISHLLEEIEDACALLRQTASPIQAHGARWTEEQQDQAASAFLAEYRRTWNQNLNAKESRVNAMRAALATQNATQPLPALKASELGEDHSPRAVPQSTISEGWRPNTIETGKPMPYFCPACQAIPAHGYCKLKGCPTAPTQDAEGGEHV